MQEIKAELPDNVEDITAIIDDELVIIENN
jgi:hypothetical protein